MKKNSFCIMFLSLSLILLAGNPADAQEAFGEILSGAPQSWVIRGSAESTEKTHQQKFLLSAPVNRVATDPVNLTWKWSQLEFKDTPQLEDRTALANRYYDSEFGVNYKHVVNSNQFWGFASSVGSASDRAFSSQAKTVLSFTAFYTESEDPAARWLWFLNYSNNRSFLNEIPIPGFAYVYRPSADFMGIFGVPFASVRWKWDEKWASIFFLGPSSYKAEVDYFVAGPAQIFISLDRSVQSFYRIDRVREKDRLFYSQNRALLGFKSPLSRNLSAEIYGGSSFQRSLVEEEDSPGYFEKVPHFENERVLGAQISGRF